jgi:hypothetical protein
MKTTKTAARIESLRKYLEDCKNGMDFSKAFSLHKERMKVVPLKKAA